DWCGLSNGDAARAARVRRRARPAGPRRRGVRRSRVRRRRSTVRTARSRRGDHFVLELVESLSGARLANGLDGDWALATSGGGGGRGEKTGGRPALQRRADAVRGGAGAHG